MLNAAPAQSTIINPDLRSRDKQLLRAIATVFKRCYQGSPWNETWSVDLALSRLRATYVDRDGIFVVKLDHERKVLGFACGASANKCADILASEIAPPLHSKFRDAHTFYYGEVCVDPQARRRGLASELQAELLSKAKRRGYTNVVAMTRPDHVAVVRLLKDRAQLSKVASAQLSLADASNQVDVFFGALKR